MPGLFQQEIKVMQTWSVLFDPKIVFQFRVWKIVTFVVWEHLPAGKKRFNNNLILRGLDLSFQQKKRFSNHFYGYFSLIVGFVFIKVSIFFCDKLHNS